MASQRVTSGVRAEAYIHSDPETTWRMWADPNELPRWFPGIESASKSDGNGGVTRVRLNDAADAEIEILEAEEPTAFTYRLPGEFGGLGGHTGTVTIKPSLTGTEVGWTVKLDQESGGFLGMGGPKGPAQREMSTALAALKTLLEAEAYRRPDVDPDKRRSRWDEL